MYTSRMVKCLLSVAFCFCTVVFVFLQVVVIAPEAQANGAHITLPKPDIHGGKSLMEALSLRKSTRELSETALSEQELSNLLWATWGVNRPNYYRTAPTSKNEQNIEVYVAMKSGVWLYDGVKHELALVLNIDARPYFAYAPLTLIYAAEADHYASAMHVGSLYQNAGLYCASVGLGNVVKGVGADALEGKLQLPAGYKVFIIQAVGWPK